MNVEEFKIAKPILKKPSDFRQQRPASLGHSSMSSRSNGSDQGRNSLNQKRLSWGKSKVLEFYKAVGQLNQSDELSPQRVSTRDRNARRSMQYQGGRLTPPKSKYLEVANEYEVALNTEEKFSSSEHVQKEEVKVDIQPKQLTFTQEQQDQVPSLSIGMEQNKQEN